MSAFFERVKEHTFGQVPQRRLRWFRSAFAFSLLVYTLAWSRNASEWLTTEGFHATPEATYGFQWPVPPLPPALLPFVLGGYLLCIVAVMFEWRPRLASWGVYAGLLYVTWADRLGAFTMNKIFIACWLVLLLAPWPKDEGRAGAKSDEDSGASGDATLSAWPIRILQATLLLQYVGAGACKLLGDWLTTNDVLWAQAQLPFMTDQAAWMIREVPKSGWAVFQWLALLFEVGAPLLFCVRRLRPVAYLWGIGMHIAIAALMYEVGYFSIQIVAFYILFLDEKTLVAFERRLGGWLSPRRDSPRHQPS